MKNRIQETRCKNGSKVTISSYEVIDLDHHNYGEITYIVESTTSADKRFYGWFSDAVDRFNSVVTKNNV